MSLRPELPVVRQFLPSAHSADYVQFSPNGAYFVSSGVNLFGPSPLTLYDRETWEPIVTLFAIKFAFSPDSRFLYLMQYLAVERFDLAARQVTATYPVPNDRTEYLSVSPSGRRVAVAKNSRLDDTFPHEIYVFDPEDGSVICHIPTEPGWPVFVDFLDEDRLCVTLGSRGEDWSELHLFAVPSGEHLRQLETPPVPKGGTSTEFGTGRFFSRSPDGNHVATYTEGGALLRIWNTNDGSILHDLRFAEQNLTVGLMERYHSMSISERSHVWQSRFSPDGTQIATEESALVSGSQRLRIWNVFTGEEEQELPWITRRSLNQLAWDPRGELLAITGTMNDEETILFWNFADASFFAPLSTAEAADVTTITFLDNATVLWGGSDSALRCGYLENGNSEIWATIPPVPWQAPTTEEDEEYPEDSYVRADMLTDIRKLTLHPSGKILASAHGSGILRLWDVEKRTVLHELRAMRWDWDGYDPDYGEPDLDGDFTADGQYLVIAGNDMSLRLWNVETGAEVSGFPIENLGEWNAIAQIAAVSCLEDAPICAAISDRDRNVLQVWNLETQEKLSEVPGSRGGYVRNDTVDNPQFCLLSKGKYAVQSNGYGSIWIYSLPDWELRHEIIVWENSAIGPFAAAPNAPFIAVGSSSEGISLRAIPSGREIAYAPFTAGEVLCLRFSQDGRYLAAGGKFGIVTVYDLAEIGNS